MKKLSSIVILLMMISVPVLCQDHPKAEVFGGYQYTRIRPGSGISGENFNGWNAALTGNVKPSVGITADFSGAYKTISGVSLKQYTFLFGPTIASHSSDKFTPFMHALLGGARSSASLSGVGSTSDTAFALALGGGVDVGSKNIAVRVGQFDYLLTRFGGTSQNNFRYSAGVVFRFGS